MISAYLIYHALPLLFTASPLQSHILSLFGPKYLGYLSLLPHSHSPCTISVAICLKAPAGSELDASLQWWIAPGPYHPWPWGLEMEVLIMQGLLSYSLLAWEGCPDGLLIGLISSWQGGGGRVGSNRLETDLRQCSLPYGIWYKNTGRHLCR